MTQSEREALAEFVISTNTGIKGLTNLMSQIAHQIDNIKERISAQEALVPLLYSVERRISAIEGEYIQTLKRGEGNGEEDSNSCEPTQEESNAN
tara:strand:+ start:299 stop:580 length:282 start_codon:yes stop_codon:yes gene_type:complete